MDATVKARAFLKSDFPKRHSNFPLHLPMDTLHPTLIKCIISNTELFKCFSGILSLNKADSELLLSESSSSVSQAGWGTVPGHTIKTSSYSWLPVSVLQLFLHATVAHRPQLFTNYRVLYKMWKRVGWCQYVSILVWSCQHPALFTQDVLSFGNPQSWHAAKLWYPSRGEPERKKPGAWKHFIMDLSMRSEWI